MFRFRRIATRPSLDRSVRLRTVPLTMSTVTKLSSTHLAETSLKLFTSSTKISDCLELQGSRRVGVMQIARESTPIAVSVRIAVPAEFDLTDNGSERSQPQLKIAINARPGDQIRSITFQPSASRQTTHIRYHTEPRKPSRCRCEWDPRTYHLC